MLGVLIAAAVPVIIYLLRYPGHVQATRTAHSHALPVVLVTGLRFLLVGSIFSYLIVTQKRPGAVSCICIGWVMMPLYAVPLSVMTGNPRFAHIMTRISWFGMGRALAVYNELRAFAVRDRGADQKQLQPRVIFLFDLPTDSFVRNAALASLALLDALLGDWAMARTLFRLIQDLSYTHASRSIRSYAQAWLLADAANRGAYGEVVELSFRGPLTFQRRYFRARALYRLRRAPPPSRWLEASAWVFAPIFRYRLGPTPMLAGASVRPELTVGCELIDVRRATFDALRLNSSGQIARNEVRRLACAWQNALESGAVLERLRHQAQQLDAPIDADALVTRIEEESIELLTELWRRALPDTSGPPPDPPLLCYAKDRIQSELLDDIQRMVGELPHGKDERAKHFEVEWRRWAQLRAKVAAFEGLLPERSEQLFHAAALGILNYGAWLYNAQKACALSNDVFRWLSKRYPKDHVDYKTVKRNVRISAGA